MWSAPLEASGRRPSAGDFAPLGSSVRPARHAILGPPMCSMATAPARVQRSAYETPGKRAFRRCIWLRASESPALPPQKASGVKRMRAPSEPPEPSSLEYEPEACHARRTKSGPYEPSSYAGFSSMSSAMARRSSS
eukprot:Amastigsp_a680616_17.p3 type:complete len:136 gc:universal Amastigsp_a680616_17:671-264(-)